MSAIRRIRKAIREGRYDITDHAKEEAEADRLRLRDVIAILLSGEIDSTYEDDLRGTRYVVRGELADAAVDVVCRFDSGGRLLIVITVYVID